MKSHAEYMNDVVQRTSLHHSSLYQTVAQIKLVVVQCFTHQHLRAVR